MIFKDAFQPKSSYVSKQTKSGNSEYLKQNLGFTFRETAPVPASGWKFEIYMLKRILLDMINGHSVYFLKVSMVTGGHSLISLCWFQMLLLSSAFRLLLLALISVHLKKSLSCALVVQRFILQIIWGRNSLFLGVCNIWVSEDPESQHSVKTIWI